MNDNPNADVIQVQDMPSTSSTVTPKKNLQQKKKQPSLKCKKSPSTSEGEKELQVPVDLAIPSSFTASYPSVVSPRSSHLLVGNISNSVPLNLMSHDEGSNRGDD